MVDYWVIMTSHGNFLEISTGHYDPKNDQNDQSLCKNDQSRSPNMTIMTSHDAKMTSHDGQK